MKRWWITGAVFALAITPAFAADTVVRTETGTEREKTTIIEREDRNWMAYNANEIVFSVFGTGTVGKKTLRHPSEERIERDNKLGAGAGIGYFFCRWVGIEAYGFTESTHHNWVD